MRIQLVPLLLGAVALPAGSALAQVAPAPADAEVDADAAAGGVPAITVTALRLPRAAIDLPATVSVLDAERIEAELATDIQDLIRFEPGVSVRAQPARFTAAFSSTGRDGNSGFNIRGLEGNRVLIQIDGIRLPDSFSFGAQSVGRGDYADLDLLKSVEILRGPASALYGSDGLAGAVSFITRDPEDFLQGDERFGGRVRLAYAHADESFAEGLVLAGRAGPVAAMAAYSRRDSGPQKNQGTIDSRDATRTTPNPQDIQSDSLLAKLVWSASAAHRVRATYERLDRKVETQVLTAVARPPLSATSTLRLSARDTSARERASLDWRYAGEGLVRSAQLAGHWQQSRTREFADEDRNTAPDRTRDNRFDNRVWGLSGQAEASFATGAIGHTLTAGGDVSSTRQTGLRDGTVPPFGETFPTKAFPDTDYRLAGAFLQDEIRLADGALNLYPALRFDSYRLDPKPDPLFPAQSAGQSGTRISPKFGAVGWIAGRFGLFASYAAGFKAPTPSQVNNGFTNVASGYASIPNPDLRPETSDTFEAGLRLREARLGATRLTASLTGFAGWYADFIEQRQVSGSFRPTDPAIFQFVNAAQARIHGVEGRAQWQLAPWLGARIAGAWARGTRTDGSVEEPLSSIDPVKVVGALEYRDPQGRFGGQAILTHAARKPQARVREPCSPGCFTPAGFTILDITAFWRPAPFVTLRAGLFNVTDARYWWWADVRGLSASSTVLDSYTQPGRNVSASIAMAF